MLAGNTDLTGVTIEIAGMAIGCLYATAHISGAHLNTAVTWMFALKGIFPWKWTPLYWTAQLVGGILAGAFILAFFGTANILLICQQMHAPLGTAQRDVMRVQSTNNVYVHTTTHAYSYACVQAATAATR